MATNELTIIPEKDIFCAGCRNKYCYCTCGEGKWVILKDKVVDKVRAKNKEIKSQDAEITRLRNKLRDLSKIIKRKNAKLYQLEQENKDGRKKD